MTLFFVLYDHQVSASILQSLSDHFSNISPWFIYILWDKPQFGVIQLQFVGLLLC